MKPLRTSALFALVLLASAVSPAASQPVPLGPEFRVNEADVHALEAPALALGASGRLLAVWPHPTDEGNDLLVRLFARDGRPAGPVTVITGWGTFSEEPQVVALPSGGFALAWERVFFPPITAPESHTLPLRILDAGGALLGEEILIEAPETPWSRAEGARIAVRPAGGLIATWTSGDTLYRRFFDADGRPEDEPLALVHSPVGSLTNDALAALDDGGFLAISSNDPLGNLPPSHVGLRLDAAGQPEGGSFGIPGGLVAIGRDGRFALAWSDVFPGVPPGSGMDARLALYSSRGTPLGPALVAADGPGDQVVQAVAMDEDGRILVVWSNETPQSDAFVDGDLSARLFSANGAPLGPAFAVATHTAGDQLGARAVGKDGDWVISWVTETAAAGGGNLFARRFATCATDGPSLCLGGRFRAEVTWKIPGAGQATGQTGSGRAVPLTGDTGAFWFFSPENLELVVKALDGRAVNDRFWVFYGALSDVEYDLTVTDTHTGEAKTYHNPAGAMASRADTRAFAGEGPFGALVPVTPIPWGGGAPILPWPCPDGQLCLDALNLYTVEVTWKIPATGETGRGIPVRVTDDTGYFWFFDEGNVELMVKMVNGHAVNGKRWIFYGALSDVEYTIKVTERITGRVKTYHNPAGTMASRADTAAF